MSNPEEAPPRRIEEGNIVLFFDTDGADPDLKERGVVITVNHDTFDQRANITIFSDERVESDVPFSFDGYEQTRGYVYADPQYEEGGPL